MRRQEFLLFLLLLYWTAHQASRRHPDEEERSVVRALVFTFRSSQWQRLAELRSRHNSEFLLTTLSQEELLQVVDVVVGGQAQQL
mmetsp:Transcript_26755/g.67430  ORF Transcript_26755/g.67430 Transcript_26755/m.67430 type:complete len:85 (-) Transcript_26755:1892-2146(-)